MTVIINPGSGPVADATEAQAAYNMGYFVADVAEAGHGLPSFERTPALDDEGRFGFTLRWEGYTREIEMPGIPLAEVRWLSEDSGNIWHFPRLYVDGSSWIWKYAVGCCEPDEPDDE